MSDIAVVDRRHPPRWLLPAAILVVLVPMWLGLSATSGGDRPFDLAPSGGEGAWLTRLLVWTLGTALALPFPMQAMLTALSAAVVGVVLFWLHRRLLYNDWPAGEAVVVVGGLALNAIVVAAVIGDHNAIPATIACAALIPAIRRLESVGDVQAEMSFGLVLPLLFLARPTTSLLIPVLAAFGAFSDPTARSDRRAFVAMFLVAVMPALLIATGLIGIMGGTESARIFRDVYLDALRPRLLGIAEARAFLVPAGIAILPFATVTIGYWLNRDRRRQPWSAVAVLVLPLGFLVGAVLFAWPTTPATPILVFLAGFASWLAVARLSSVFRRVSAALVVLSAAMSWTVLPLV
jgi:hypothetical protein